MTMQGPTVDVDGKKTVLWYFTGKVLSSQKQKETQISSHNVGTQNRPQVSVQSTTVDHHEFFLVDANGKEDSFHMTDFDFPCREGQTISVVWAIPEDAETGNFIHVRNHNTDQSFKADPKNIADPFRKPAWMVWGIGAGLVIVTIPILGPLCLFAVLISYFYFRWRSRKAAKGLLASPELKKLDEELARVQPLAA